MSKVIIYHNPRCSKSRESLAILRGNGTEPEIVEYLKAVPSKNDLKLLLAKLNMNVKDIIRKNELVYKQKFKQMNFTDEEWLSILIEHPKLIERPIVVKGNRAVIGRPPTKVLEL